MSSPTSAAMPDLAMVRTQIDTIDRRIHGLLMQRTVAVQDVIRAKAAATAAGDATPAFRPGREAAVLRTLAERHKGDFPLPSLLRIWREVISGNTRIQGVQTIAVPQDFTAGWLHGRDHFGLGAAFACAESPADALAMVRTDRAAAAVLPMPLHGNANGLWWCDLLNSEAAEGTPKIVACLPFFATDLAEPAIVASAFKADPSGKDETVLGFRLANEAFATAGPILGALATVGMGEPPVVAGEYILAVLPGWHDADSPALGTVSGLPAVERFAILGHYATPLYPFAQPERFPDGDRL